MKTYTSKITKDDCDLFNHMNTLKYIQKFYDAADIFLEAVGLSDPVMEEKNLGTAYLEFNTKFIKEVFEGQEVEIFADVKEMTSKVVTLAQQMRDKHSGEKVSEMELKFLIFDLESRKSIKLEDERLNGCVQKMKKIF